MFLDIDLVLGIILIAFFFQIGKRTTDALIDYGVKKIKRKKRSRNPIGYK